MPKKHANRDKGKRLSYYGGATSPNITARPTRIVVDMFKYGSIRRERT